MRPWLALTAAVLLSGADVSPVATYFDHAKVAAALAKGWPLISAPDLTVSGSHRTKPGQLEVHPKETDIVDGEATFVTEGTEVDGKVTTLGQLLGSNIQGGQAHHLSKGDMMVIPAGMPHRFKEVPQSISYYVVKS